MGCATRFEAETGRRARWKVLALGAVTGRETANYRLFTVEEMRAIEGSKKPAKFGAIEALELWPRQPPIQSPKSAP